MPRLRAVNIWPDDWDQEGGGIDCVVCGSTIFSQGVFAPGVYIQKERTARSGIVTYYTCSLCKNITTRTEDHPPEKKEVEELKLPTHTKPLLGLRKWIVRDDSILWSTGVNQQWDTSAPMKAQCQHNVFSWLSLSEGVDEHEAPSRDCGCGLYAFYDFPALHKEFSKDVVTVTGVVSAWGRVIECENGMRAEYMQLEAFVLDRQTVRVLGAPVSVSPILRLLAKKHNVPLILPGEIDSFAGEKDLIKLKPQKLERSTPPHFTLPYPPPGASGYGVYLASNGTFANKKADPPEEDTVSAVTLPGYGKWKRIMDRLYGKGKE